MVDECVNMKWLEETINKRLVELFEIVHEYRTRLQLARKHEFRFLLETEIRRSTLAIKAFEAYEAEMDRWELHTRPMEKRLQLVTACLKTLRSECNFDVCNNF